MIRPIRFQILIFLMILFMVLTSGCSSTDQESTMDTSTDKQQINTDQIVFRITWKVYSGRGEAIGRIVDAYNAKNEDGYQISLADGDEDSAAIAALLDDGSQVDLYMLPYRYVQYFGYQNKLENLSKELGFEKNLFYDELWRLGTVDHQVYGIPWLGHSMALIYNKQLLDKAGVDPSEIRNPQGLAEACRKVEASTDAFGIGLVGANHNDVSWMVNQFIYGFGGSLVTPDGKQTAVNSEAAKKAIEYYKNTLGQYAQDTWTADTGVEVMDYFRDQKVAFEIQGPWGITDIWKSDRKFDTGVIPLDQIGLCPEVGPMMLSLQPNLSDAKRAAAIQFIQYLISQKAQEMIMDGEYSPERDTYYPFRLPVRTDIAKSMVFKKYPEFGMFLSGFSKPSVDVPVPLWQKVKDDYYAPGLHAVMEGTLSVDEFLLQIEQKGNQILQGVE